VLLAHLQEVEHEEPNNYWMNLNVTPYGIVQMGQVRFAVSLVALVCCPFTRARLVHVVRSRLASVCAADRSCNEFMCRCSVFLRLCVRSQKFRGTIHFPLDLHSFPFDCQTLKIQLQ
jgi:hypothetical protein